MCSHSVFSPNSERYTWRCIYIYIRKLRHTRRGESDHQTCVAFAAPSADAARSSSSSSSTSRLRAELRLEECACEDCTPGRVVVRELAVVSTWRSAASALRRRSSQSLALRSASSAVRRSCSIAPAVRTRGHAFYACVSFQDGHSFISNGRLLQAQPIEEDFGGDLSKRTRETCGLRTAFSRTRSTIFSSTLCYTRRSKKEKTLGRGALGSLCSRLERVPRALLVPSRALRLRPPLCTSIRRFINFS